MLVIFKSDMLAYTKNLWRNKQGRQIQIHDIVLQGSGLTEGPVMKKENRCTEELQADGVRNHVQKKSKYKIYRMLRSSKKARREDKCLLWLKQSERIQANVFLKSPSTNRTVQKVNYNSA